MADSTLPTQKAERIAVLDAVRGFALLGIFLANIRGFSGWEDLSQDAKVALGGDVAYRATEFLHLMLINAKFYTIFSFLFGLGFALQISRLKGRGDDGTAIYRRRLWLLLVIGLAHMTFFWDSDVLTLYAALGFALPVVNEWHDRKLLIGAAFLLVLPVVGYVLVAKAGLPADFGLYGLGDRLTDALSAAWTDQAARQDMPLRYVDDWGAYWTWVIPGPIFRGAVLIETWRIPKVLGTMMLGIWAGRRLIDGTLLTDRKLLKRVAVVGYLIGLPANAAYAFTGGFIQDNFFDGLLTSVLHALGVVPLGLAYAATIVLLWHALSRTLAFLKAPGRMALTNYLLQSLLGIAIFYGIGLGLGQTLSPQMMYLFAVIILMIQILLSHLWLRYFRQGPLEWLWRIGTYKSQRVVHTN